MHLLPLLNEGVVLGDSFQRQLVHEIDLVGVLEVFPHEGLDGEGEGGGVEQDLPAVRKQNDPMEITVFFNIFKKGIQTLAVSGRSPCPTSP